MSPRRLARCERLWLLGLLGIGGCFDLGTHPWEPETEPIPFPTNVTTSTVSAGPESSSPTPMEACSRAPEEFTVLLVLNKFVPARLEICAGDTVTWQNQDSKEHTIFSGTPETPTDLLSTTKIFQGQSFSFTFEVPGEYVYYCSVHKKKMRDAVVVVR
ncbi:MAG: cupredoxin domain-containing protein [Deltaproteobacteria bacterium]|nr:cupredoxin domain-containing protein [Deltaproteobacteria bacterium]